MDPVTDTPVLAFDTETTGVDVTSDRIVTIALIEVAPGRRPVTHSWLIDPGVDIPDEAAAVHGISTERARAEGVTPGLALFEAAGRIALALGRGIPVVGFNVAFDFSIFEAECARHGVDTLSSRLPQGVEPVLDVRVLDKAADPYRRGGRKLTDVCATYGVVHTGAHDADADALAAARLWPRVIERHPDTFAGMSLMALHRAQVGWLREQANGLRSYFDRKGIAHDGVDPGWPLHTGVAASGRGAA